MPNTKIINTEIRQQIKDFLRSALKGSIRSYHDYMDGILTADQKADFEKAHKAGKAALSHIETLIELASVADISTEGGGEELAALLEQAGAELDLYNEGNGDE